MQFLPDFLAKRPRVAEYDFAGTIVGANGTNKFKDGDQVFGWVAPAKTTALVGALAEYVAVPTSSLAARPANVSATEISGLPLAGETAWESIVDIAQIEPGQSIFINGGWCILCLQSRIGSYLDSFQEVRLSELSQYKLPKLRDATLLRVAPLGMSISSRALGQMRCLCQTLPHGTLPIQLNT